ncbi:MAG: glycosyltransferase [Candidatus Neomarinimicrobiota bacterium]
MSNKFQPEVQNSDAAPLISVVIPAYNQRYFKASLESALNQTYPHLEILICDDCRNGDIKAVVDEVAAADERIRYVKNEKQLGRYGNYQRCFELAAGEYVKYLNDDDLLHPDCVTLLARCLQRYPGVTLVTSHRQIIDERGNPLIDLPSTQRMVSDDSLLEGRSVCNAMLSKKLNFVGEPTTAIFRKRDLEDVSPSINTFGGIQFEYINDVAMWLNLLGKGDLIYLVKTLSYFRLHSEQGQEAPDAVQRSQVFWEDILEQGQRLGYWHPEWPVEIKFQPLNVRAQWPDEALPIIKQAHDYLSNSDSTRAIGVLRKVAALAPEDPWVVVTLGDLLLQTGDVEGARREYFKATTDYPWYAPGYISLGALCLRLNKDDEAIAALRQAIKLYPANLDAWRILGRMYLKAERFDDARQAFALITRTAPQDVKSLLALGICHVGMGDPINARSIFERVLEIDPQNKTARENLAILAGQQPGSQKSGSPADLGEPDSEGS